MDPAPELTFTMRGVVKEFLSRGANASTTRRGPVALVRKQISICSAREPEGMATAALLTMASRLIFVQQNKHERSSHFLPSVFLLDILGGFVD